MPVGYNPCLVRVLSSSKADGVVCPPVMQTDRNWSEDDHGDDGHHSLRGFDMLGSFRDWRRCGEFQDRIRATKTMASTWFDKAFQSQLGSIRVMAFVSSI